MTVLMLILAKARKLNGEKDELEGQADLPSNVSSILSLEFTLSWIGWDPFG